MQGIESIDSTWLSHLQSEIQQDYMQALDQFLQQEQQAGKSILPPLVMRFNALKATSLDNIKVVILGQDPYPTSGHAHGLSFSVLPEVKPLPRSLNNIYKELLNDMNIDNGKHGCLQPWAEQGVLLLNTVLTVEQGNANSHKKRGWEQFTDRVIEIVSQQAEPSVFVLWGKPAQKKAKLIDADKHMIIESAHPSPLSASRGFFGSRPFSRINAFLRQQGRQEINWQL